jgi:hypothetical protein
MFYSTKINDTLSENRDLTDPGEIEKAIKMGEYIKNGEVCYIILRDSYLFVN